VIGGDRLAKQAAADANRGYQALAAHRARQAIGFAEAAVRAAPQDAGYRALLGQAYLQAGRFASARDAFIDTLALSPNDGRSALSLALAQIASGDWANARKTLDDHEALIPAADRGLAMALAGDPATAVELLNAAAHAPEADAKTRQNLALALAPLVSVDGRAPILWAIGFHLLSNIGWLYTAPISLALYGGRSPTAVRGTMLGVNYLMVFAASTISGRLGGLYEVISPSAFWMVHSAIAVTGGAALLLLARPIERVLNDETAPEEPTLAPA